MICIRCTRRLLVALDLTGAPADIVGDSSLGDWYANSISTMAGELVVFLNQRTLLTVAVPLDSFQVIFPVFRLRVGNLLSMIGITPSQIIKEVANYSEFTITTTNSRSTLQSLNAVSLRYQRIAEAHTSEEKISLSDVELRLSTMPQPRLNKLTASEVTRALLDEQQHYTKCV